MNVGVGQLPTNILLSNRIKISFSIFWQKNVLFTGSISKKGFNSFFLQSPQARANNQIIRIIGA
jgi:hypothetical protein